MMNIVGFSEFYTHRLQATLGQHQKNAEISPKIISQS